MPWVAIAALGVSALTLVVALRVLIRLRRLERMALLPIATGTDPGARSELERIDRLGLELSGHATRLSSVEAQAVRAFQRVGVVRYNPFEDTGSNQSFALAMLDAQGDGFVLSSLHSRQSTRVFLKQVAGGRVETAVSDEEAEAIRVATTR